MSNADLIARLRATANTYVSPNWAAEREMMLRVADEIERADIGIAGLGRLCTTHGNEVVYLRAENERLRRDHGTQGRGIMHNPWREFIENCISGSNYFRASEYERLLADLDRGYAAQARLAEAERLLRKFHESGPAGIAALIEEVPAFLGIAGSAEHIGDAAR